MVAFMIFLVFAGVCLAALAVLMNDARSHKGNEVRRALLRASESSISARRNSARRRAVFQS